jgi:excisionase family DNA binding protein
MAHGASDRLCGGKRVCTQVCNSSSKPTAQAVREQAALIEALLLLPYLTPEQAATVVQANVITIRRACAAGSLPAVRLGSKQWRITPGALQEWLAAPKPKAR